MNISEITLGQKYFACCFIDGKKDVGYGTAKGKFEYEDGSAFVDIYLSEDDGYGFTGQMIRPNVTDMFATAEEAVTALETYLSAALTTNQGLVDSLKVKYDIVD